MLQGQVLLDFAELVLQGYTLRRIRQVMLERGHDLSQVPDTPLIQLQIELAGGAAEETVALDSHLGVTHGLSRKKTRVRRLAEIAEQLEPLAITSPKWSAEYRRYLAQIRIELEGLKVDIAPDDEWAELLQRIAVMGQSVSPTEDGDTGEAEGEDGTDPEAVPA